MKKVLIFLILLLISTKAIADTAPVLLAADVVGDFVDLTWQHSDPIPDGGYDIIHNGSDPGTWRQSNSTYRFGPITDWSIEHKFIVEARYVINNNFYRSNELIADPSNLGPVLDRNVFKGYTKYLNTGQRRICWQPAPDNIPWEGVYVFDVEAYHYEREELVHAEYLLNALETTATLSSGGHYWFRGRTCTVEDNLDCSAWIYSFNPDTRFTGQRKMCDGSDGPIPYDEGWWAFLRVAAPTFPD